MEIFQERAYSCHHLEPAGTPRLLIGHVWAPMQRRHLWLSLQEYTMHKSVELIGAILHCFS